MDALDLLLPAERLVGPLVGPGVVVILGDEVDRGLASGPLRRELFRDRFHSRLVSAAVPDDV